MSDVVPAGVYVDYPTSAEIESLADAWSPIVTVRVVSRQCVLWLDPMLYTVAAVRPSGAPTQRRDGVVRLMRDPDRLIVGASWRCEVLTTSGWARLAVGHVDAITVVRFPCPGEGSA